VPVAAVAPAGAAMLSGLKRRLGERLDRYAVRRWARNRDRVGRLGPFQLEDLSRRAALLRAELDGFTDDAAERLLMPRDGSTAFERPLGTDWAYRPELWRRPVRPAGVAAIKSRQKIGTEAAIFHDCRKSELTGHQLRNTGELDIAPFGFRLDVFDFDGSFLSLVLHLPDAAVEGLEKRHVIRVSPVIELEKPLEIFARLNIRHGPNTEQILREFPMDGTEKAAEFDLAYTELNEKRVSRMWLDLIFERPAMNQVTLRDLTITRRPRANL